MDLSCFSTIVAADFEFEFGGRNGNLPRPVCMVAKELRTGEIWRLWCDEFGPEPPFPVGVDALFQFLGSGRARLFPGAGLAYAGANPRSKCRVSYSSQS